MECYRWLSLPYWVSLESLITQPLTPPQSYFSISDYATVTTSQGALIIGGNCWGSDPEDEGRVVALYNDDGWKRLADLQTQRKYRS